MKLLQELKAKETMLCDMIREYTGAEREMFKEQLNNLMPDFSPTEIFDDDADLQDVLMGHDQPNTTTDTLRKVHTDRIFVFPVQRGCGDMKVVLMAN